MKRGQPGQGAAQDNADLRQRARERLQDQGRARVQAPGTVVAGLADNPQRLLHELQVYQVELELQNEQLEAASAWIEAALASYTELYDFAPVPYFTLNRSGTITEANLAGARLLGIERARLLGRRLGVFVAESDRSRFAACLKSVFTTQFDAQCQVSLGSRDETRHIVEICTTLANNGESCRTVLIDVSARNAHERRMARLADVFTLAREGMFITDCDGVIVDINHAFSALTGYTHAQVVGRHERMIRCERQPPGLEEAITRALAFNGSWSGEIRIRRHDGEVYLVVAHISTMVNSSGAQSYVSRFSRPDMDLPVP